MGGTGDQGSRIKIDESTLNPLQPSYPWLISGGAVRQQDSWNLVGETPLKGRGAPALGPAVEANDRRLQGIEALP
jgi:hypothetical protein